MLRAIRRWVTARVSDAAVVAAPRLPIHAPDRIAGLLAHTGPRCPVIARIVADNMRALGVYSPAIHREYFAQLAAHFAGALHALRCGGQTRGDGPSEALAHIAAQRVELDASVARLRAAAARGQGVIIMGPHIANYLLNLARLSQDVPLTVYLRHSKEARRREAKQRWYRASGVDWISEPAAASGPLGRLGRMAAALRQGRVLFITPDLPRKRGDGTPVRFFGREIYLPAGPAVMALRTGAPLFMLTARPSGPRQRLVLHGPLVADRGEGGRAGRRAAIQQCLQWFTTIFERFLTEQTPLWYLWGDKRWTRVFSGDPRYVRPLAEPVAAESSAASAGVAGAV